MKPWYKKKKIWTAVLSMIVTYIAHRFSPEIATAVAALGAVLIAGIAAEDFGKAAKAMEAEAISTDVIALVEAQVKKQLATMKDADDGDDGDAEASDGAT